MNNLRFRIFISIIILLVIGLAAITLLFNYGLDRYFSDYQMQEEAANINRLERQLAEISENEGESAVFDYLEQYARINQLEYIPEPDDREPGAEQMEHHGMMGNRRMNPENGRRMMQSFEDADLSQGYNIVINNNDFGVLIWPEQDGQPAIYTEIAEQTTSFRNEVNSFILPLGLVMILAGGLISFWLSRKLALPVNKLADEVAKLGEGDYEIEVPEKLTGELRRLGLAVKSLAGRLKYLEKIRRESASDFSHELRTPLHNLKNTVEALEDGVLPMNQDNLESINEEVERITALTAQLTELVEFEKKLTDVKIESVDGREYFKELLNSHQKKAESEQINFDYQISSKLDRVNIDKQAVEIILNNLITNALKYTEADGRVEVRVNLEAGNLKLEVEDTGIGIPDAEKDLIFERFYRTDRSRSRKTGGSGLGLAITREIVAALGGRISLESKSKGSNFIVQLPQ
ncbi:MAG: sensor histidine kinase [Halarsenatibacteraceae bacterium]